MVEYDKIAEKYADSVERRSGRKYGMNPAFIKILGNVEGKNVLDLACGDGFLTRKIKELGAKTSKSLPQNIVERAKEE